MDGILTEDIKGIKPDSVFRINNIENGNILQYKFQNLSPVNADNIIITYSENLDNFNFENILKGKENLYKSIDIFSEMEIKTSGLVNMKFDDPFEVVSSDWTSTLIILGIIGIPALIIISMIILLVIFFKWYSKRRKNKI